MTRRPHCLRCARPLAGCLCACIRPLDNAAPLLILQHPDEARQAKGTAGLLELCLSRCERLVGEQFAPPPPDDHPLLLLYPPDPARPEPPATASGPVLPRLVLLDGTWRQSRQLLRASPWLQDLPRLALSATPCSRYAIRKAHAPHQLSSLEAAALALAQLQPGLDNSPLWQALESFIALQLALKTAGQAPASGRSGASG